MKLVQAGTDHDLRLRAERDEDRELLCRLYGSTRADELAQVPWSDDEKERFVRFQFEAQRRFYREQYPGAHFDLVELDGAPVGRLYVVEWASEIRLMDLALLPEHRGRGLGTSLLRSLQARAETAGKPLSVHVERLNPAQRLYRRLGFEEVEDKGVYLLLEWRPAGSTGASAPVR